MSNRHAVCLVIDGLRASALGTYGNTIYPTPHFDTLASRAVVADWLYADSVRLEDFYRAVWQGKHSLRPDGVAQQPTVLDRLREANVNQLLVTDDPWMCKQAGERPFDETFLFETGADQPADQIENTVLGRFFSTSIAQLHNWQEQLADSSGIAWLHCRGLHGPWDAPRELREELLDEEDPTATDFVEPPSALRDIDDPDVLLEYRVAYAAQIAVLDAVVGAFVQEVEQLFAGEETLILLSGSRGFALGEHGSIGAECVDLFNEQLHLPWLIYPCGNTTPLPRIHAFSCPADIGETLTEWIEGEHSQRSDGISCLPLLSNGEYVQRQLVVSQGVSQERAIRTPAWMLRQTQSGEKSTTELYSKPDDQWEYNDVADRCPQVVEELCQELASFEKACRGGEAIQRATRDSFEGSSR